MAFLLMLPGKREKSKEGEGRNGVGVGLTEAADKAPMPRKRKSVKGLTCLEKV